MPDTREGRDKKGLDKEKRQREHDLEEEVQYEQAAEDRRKEHDELEAEAELAEDE